MDSAYSLGLSVMTHLAFEQEIKYILIAPCGGEWGMVRSYGCILVRHVYVIADEEEAMN